MLSERRGLLATRAALDPGTARGHRAFAVFAAYPYLKRFTPLCHAGVGVALALAPLAGFAAAHPALEHTGPAFALALFALCWVTGFDIIYATLDEASDRANGIHSMVVWLGRTRALRVSWALHLVAIRAGGAPEHRHVGGRTGHAWLAGTVSGFAGTVRCRGWNNAGPKRTSRSSRPMSSGSWTRHRAGRSWLGGF